MEDLAVFKEELLEDLQKILQDYSKGISPKKWLKSTEVMELLKISPGTLQNFRVNGTLPYSKIGGMIYYDSEDINEVLKGNKIYNAD